MKKYEKIPNSPKELKIEIYYHKGGTNYFTYKNEERGYYLSISPVIVERRADGIIMEQYTAFSGVKKCILPVKRQSEKQYTQACEIAAQYELELKQYILNKISG